MKESTNDIKTAIQNSIKGTLYEGEDVFKGESIEDFLTEIISRTQSLERDCVKLFDALDFYANEETYFAIGFFPDPPCGEFIDDFSDTSLGFKPGKLARQVTEDVRKHWCDQKDKDSV